MRRHGAQTTLVRPTAMADHGSADPPTGAGHVRTHTPWWLLALWGLVLAAAAIAAWVALSVLFTLTRVVEVVWSTAP